MKAYITCPVTHTREKLNQLPEIKKIVELQGMDAFVFEIGGSPEEIFSRDYQQLKECNLLIAEVSERSHGVGIEIGISYCLGLKIILLIELGRDFTKLAQGIPGVIIIEYKDNNDLQTKLALTLSHLDLHLR